VGFNKQTIISMNLKQLSNLFFDLYYFKFAALKKRKVVPIEFYKEDNFQPIFILSTGRTGTKLISNLLKKDDRNVVFHSPNPELIEQGKVVYNFSKERDSAVKNKSEILEFEIFKTAREFLLAKSIKYDKRYIEANNRITFFAPLIKKYIPNAKFIHLYRHPGEFVRSGIRRKWYTGGHDHDTGRICPTINSPEYADWGRFDSLQKISWLWKETNSFIEEFLASLKNTDFIQINFNELSIDNINEILRFTNSSVSKGNIKKILKYPVNSQSSGYFPKYENWNEEDKTKMKDICSKLALKYKYDL
jgi:hypothetical protein